jgi:hypothetical protein
MSYEPPNTDLPTEWPVWGEHARYVFLERLGIGTLNGMKDTRGTPAWVQAWKEAKQAHEQEKRNEASR